MARHFAHLLINLKAEPKKNAALIKDWQSIHLSRMALSRIDLIRRGAIQLSSSERPQLDYAKNLPDIILADVFPAAPKVVFVEVIATNGAITEQRRQALLESAVGYNREHLFFVSAFADRSAAAFRKLVAELAWGTFAWFASEPGKLLLFRNAENSLDL